MRRVGGGEGTGKGTGKSMRKLCRNDPSANDPSMLGGELFYLQLELFTCS